MNHRYLITGVAGFIGFHLAYKLLKQKKIVIGIDNLNTYYDVELKKSRLNILKKFSTFKFYKIDICNAEKLNNLFLKNKFKKVYHLAAQAGVRYSLEQPREYIKSNINGFFNILEVCKDFKSYLIYASSSSVYGASEKFPFSEKDYCSHPIQLYAATKRSNELMAHSYSALYNLPTSGIRFFTVYGPWGRPDQALFLFTKNILNNKKINLFNRGKHSRDFTYIDDIIDGIIRIGNKIPKKNSSWKAKNPIPSSSKFPFEIYNIASNKNIKLTKYVSIIEKYLGKKALVNKMPLQKGDVINVSSNIGKISNKLKYKPKTNVESGVIKFIDWYLDYYKVK